MIAGQPEVLRAKPVKVVQESLIGGFGALVRQVAGTKYSINRWLLATRERDNRLQRLAFAEIEPGQWVMQPASVYGSFGPNLARHVGSQGRVDIVDVARVQVESATRKLAPYPWARAHHANCLDFDRGPYDVVVCYFLLHEVPDEVKREVVNHLLGRVVPGGKVVFVDYAKPKWWHPLKLITSIVFDTLEPFAKGLWRNEVRDFASAGDRFGWRRETIFGDLFQKVVATRER